MQNFMLVLNLVEKLQKNLNTKSYKPTNFMITSKIKKVKYHSLFLVGMFKVNLCAIFLLFYRHFLKCCSKTWLGRLNIEKCWYKRVFDFHFSSIIFLFF